jgi:hypothetical protein
MTEGDVIEGEKWLLHSVFYVPAESSLRMQCRKMAWNLPKPISTSGPRPDEQASVLLRFCHEQIAIMAKHLNYTFWPK